MANTTNKTKKGYVAISMTLILLVVTIGIISTLFVLSSGNSKNYESLRLGEKALYLTDACLEEALLRLKNNPFYEGGKIFFPEGDCHANIEKNNESYVLTTYFSSAEKHWRPIEARVELVEGILKMTGWKEKNIDIE